MHVEEQIKVIRQFNRDYTAEIGLLEKHVLNSEYTFSETRILLEVDRIDHCTAKNISEALNMDAGFVSRTINRLIKLNLVEKLKSEKDKRAFLLQTTESGKSVISELHKKANAQIMHLIENLSSEERTRVLHSIGELNTLILGKNSNAPEYITLRNELKPGDVGQLIKMHGELYSKECGYNVCFEGYVCKTFYEAIVHGNAKLDKYWIAEKEGVIIGSIAVIAKAHEACQLRWLLVSPEYRGIGLGIRLFDEAMAYATAGKFKSIFLETTKEQEKAIQLYEKAGFKQKSTYKIDDWGKSLTGLVMEKLF